MSESGDRQVLVDAELLDVELSTAGDGLTAVVFVSAAEFIRVEPFESQLRKAVDRALRDVPGVVEVEEDDRETWLVSGVPNESDVRRLVVDAVTPIAHAFCQAQARESED